jgi:hypothetical protein
MYHGKTGKTSMKGLEIFFPSHLPFTNQETRDIKI